MKLRLPIRKPLHLYFLATRALTMGVRVALRTPEGAILLVRHSYTYGWHFPGGGVEKGETALEALARELQQEIGAPMPDAPHLHGVYFNPGMSARDHILLYVADLPARVEFQPNSREISEVGYFCPKTLPSDTEEGTLRRIEEIRGTAAPAETW